MGIVNILKSRKYLFRIYLLITTTLLLIMTMFSAIIYYNVERIALQDKYNDSQKILYQMKYNIEQMNEMVKNLCVSTYFNSDVFTIMFSDSEDEMYNNIIKMNRIASAVVYPNSFVHSIYIYNNINKTYYSTYDRTFYNDTVLKDLIRTLKIPPRIKPVFRKIKVNNSNVEEYENVFSYFMYETLDVNNQMEGAVIVNVRLSWLFDNIEMINMVDKQNQDRIFILDKEEEFIEDKPLDAHLKEPLKELYNKYKSSGNNLNKETGFFTGKINNIKYVITYVNVDRVDWVLLKIQPYNKLYEYINKSKIIIVIITGIFLLLTIIASMSISKRIYRPVSNLLKQVSSVRSHNPDKLDYIDEISYLSEVYKSSTDQLDAYKKEKNSHKDILKSYFLKKLLVDISSISEEEFIRDSVENNIILTLDSNLVLCMIKIDNYRDFMKKYGSRDKELFKFAIMNISGEIISICFKNEITDMGDDRIIVILNADTKSSDFSSKLADLLKKAQEYILNYYGISISATISEKISNVNDLSEAYNSVLNNSMYRYIYGRMSIISPDMIRENTGSIHIDYHSTYEKKLMDGIKSSNVTNVEDTVLKILKEVSKLNYYDIMLSVMYLANSIKNAVEEINQMKLKPRKIYFPLSNQDILDMETIDEFYYKMMEFIKQAMYGEDIVPSRSNEKHAVLVQAVQDVINANYYDGNLCINSIASILKMYPTHISKIFKENTNMSVPDYIAEIRMNKAVELLENSKMSVDDIMVKVGIENRSSFFKLFKRKYGLTPREYAIKKTLNRL